MPDHPLHASQVDAEVGELVANARRSLAAPGRSWASLAPERQLLGMGWVGFVESVVAEWVARDVREREVTLNLLIDAATRFGFATSE